MFKKYQSAKIEQKTTTVSELCKFSLTGLKTIYSVFIDWFYIMYVIPPIKV